MENDVIYCGHCGQKNIKNARYCSKCGQRIEVPNLKEYKGQAGMKGSDYLECPYCENMMRVPLDVTQLICIECAAALRVEEHDGQRFLDIQYSEQTGPLGMDYSDSMTFEEEIYSPYGGQAIRQQAAGQTSATLAQAELSSTQPEKKVPEKKKMSKYGRRITFMFFLIVIIIFLKVWNS